MSNPNTLNDQPGGDEQHTLVNKGSYVDHILRKQRVDALDRLFTQPSIDQKFRFAILNKVEKHWNQAYPAQDRSAHYQLQQVDKAETEWGVRLSSSAVQTRNGRDQKQSRLTDLTAATPGQGMVITGGDSHQRTLLLLDLLFDLIRQAKKNSNAPIPLYFNLRSWSQTPMPLADWLVEEGLIHYQISRYFMWDPLISRQQLVLVLDGFDEIKADCREAAAFTLKQFQENLGMPIVVATEKRDAAELVKRFKDGAWVEIEGAGPENDRLKSAEAVNGELLAESGYLTLRPVLEAHSISRFAIEQVQPNWLPASELTLISRLILWLTGGYRKPIVLPDEISFYKGNFRPFAVEALRGVGIGLLIGFIFAIFIGRSQGLALGLVSGLAIGYLFGFEKLIKIDRVHPNDSPNRGIWGAARNAIKGGIMLSLLLGLTASSLVGIIAAFAGVPDIMVYQGWAVLIGGLIGVWVGFVRYGGLVFIRHYVTRFELARHDLLPHPFKDSKLVQFLDQLVHKGVLRRAGGGWILP